MPSIFQDLDMFIVFILLNTQKVLRFLFAVLLLCFQNQLQLVYFFFLFLTVSFLFKDIGEVAYNRDIIVTQGCRTKINEKISVSVVT